MITLILLGLVVCSFVLGVLLKLRANKKEEKRLKEPLQKKEVQRAKAETDKKVEVKTDVSSSVNMRSKKKKKFLFENRKKIEL